MFFFLFTFSFEFCRTCLLLYSVAGNAITFKVSTGRFFIYCLFQGFHLADKWKPAKSKLKILFILFRGWNKVLQCAEKKRKRKEKKITEEIIKECLGRKWNLQNAKHMHDDRAPIEDAPDGICSRERIVIVSFLIMIRAKLLRNPMKRLPVSAYHIEKWSNKNALLRCSVCRPISIYHNCCAFVRWRKKTHQNWHQQQNCVAGFHFCCWVYFAPFFQYLK